MLLKEEGWLQLCKWRRGWILLFICGSCLSPDMLIVRQENKTTYFLIRSGKDQADLHDSDPDWGGGLFFCFDFRQTSLHLKEPPKKELSRGWWRDDEDQTVTEQKLPDGLFVLVGWWMVSAEPSLSRFSCPPCFACFLLKHTRKPKYGINVNALVLKRSKSDQQYWINIGAVKKVKRPDQIDRVCSPTKRKNRNLWLNTVRKQSQQGDTFGVLVPPNIIISIVTMLFPISYGFVVISMYFSSIYLEASKGGTDIWSTKQQPSIRMQRIREGIHIRAMKAKRKVEEISKEDVQAFFKKNAFVLFTVAAVVLGEWDEAF